MYVLCAQQYVKVYCVYTHIYINKLVNQIITKVTGLNEQAGFRLRGEASQTSKMKAWQGLGISETT